MTTPRPGGHGGPFASSRDPIEIDDGARRVCRIYASAYPEPMGMGMGMGKMVHSEHGPMRWNTVSPNTIMKRVVDTACMHPWCG